MFWFTCSFPHESSEQNKPTLCLDSLIRVFERAKIQTAKARFQRESQVWRHQQHHHIPEWWSQCQNRQVVQDVTRLGPGTHPLPNPHRPPTTHNYHISGPWGERIGLFAVRLHTKWLRSQGRGALRRPVRGHWPPRHWAHWIPVRDFHVQSFGGAIINRSPCISLGGIWVSSV